MAAMAPKAIPNGGMEASAPKKKICCACPETKVRQILYQHSASCMFYLNSLMLRVALTQGPRDECIGLHGAHAQLPPHAK